MISNLLNFNYLNSCMRILLFEQRQNQIYINYSECLNANAMLYSSGARGFSRYSLSLIRERLSLC